MKMILLDIETSVKIRLGSAPEKLNQRQKQERTGEANVIQDECEDEKCASAQFLQTQKNQLIDLQKHLERYCIICPFFGFNSARYDLNLIKSYLLPILINEGNIEPTVIKKTNQFVSFKFGW